MEPTFTYQKSTELTTEQLMASLAQLRPELLAQSGQNNARNNSSGNNAAVCSWNQPFCDRLQQLSEKYKRDVRKENISFSLDRARKNILLVPNELRSRKDFLSVKNVGPYIARELEDVLNEITGVKSAVQGA